MTIHKKVFVDLFIKMIGFGICIGIVFPFFALLLGVGKSIAFSPLFFLACVAAGIIVGLISFFIVKTNMKKRLLGLISNMLKVNERIISFQNDEQTEEVQTDLYMVSEYSDDCFGQMASSFNTLVKTLMETLHFQKGHRSYIENLTENLDLKELSDYALKVLMMYSNASAGALLIEKEGEQIITIPFVIIPDIK